MIYIDEIKLKESSNHKCKVDEILFREICVHHVMNYMILVI